jgi:hypothetical protein
MHAATTVVGMEWFIEFIEWVWARHHNLASWYVRPLFLLPYCYFAYKRNMWGIAATLLVLPTSLFWFPAPDPPSETARRYLAWEREFVTEGSWTTKVILIVLVLIVLTGLAAAFWRRSVLFGLLILNAGTAAKVVWSVGFAGDTGWASLLPSVMSLVVVNTVVLLVMRWWRARRNNKTEVSRPRPESRPRTFVNFFPAKENAVLQPAPDPVEKAKPSHASPDDNGQPCPETSQQTL